MHFLLIVSLLLGAQFTSASAPLCIQGCCDRSLKLSSEELTLSAKSDSLTVKLESAEIPCCDCSEKEVKWQPSEPPTIDRSLPRLPIHTFDWWNVCACGACDDSCICMDDCYSISRRTLLEAKLSTVCGVVGCGTLPPHYPLCPPNKPCTDDCYCRETLLENVQNVLFPKRKEAEESNYENENANRDGHRQQEMGYKTEL